MPRTLNEAVPELCLALPDVEQFVSHGAPNFRVRGGKVFATYVLNHHGDGRVALWLSAAPGTAEHLAGTDPESYFIPPYVGPRGWLGVCLDRGLEWSEIGDRVRDAYRQVAPRTKLDAGVPIAAPPDTPLRPEQIDPLKSTLAQGALKRIREICLALPETSEDQQFGTPVWRAGKKAFAGLHAYEGVPKLSFWVGVEQQSMMVDDLRFEIPAYMGHNGWIALRCSAQMDWLEVAALAEASYRHFALKRMLTRLDARPD